jgi:hypothetical protein
MHFSINFEPYISLCATFDNGAYSHQPDYEHLSFFNRNLQFFASLWSAQEVSGRNDTGSTIRVVDYFSAPPTSNHRNVQ